jgi:tetratricopeptide (TPR) repeat protein
MAANKDYTQMAIDAKRKSDAKAETEEQKRKAFEAEIQKHATAGQAHFDLGEYDAAAKEWKDAFVRSSDPQFMPLIAAATRKTGDCTQAKTLYQDYLVKVPGAPDRAAIDAKIKEAEVCEKNLGNNFDKVRDFYNKGVTHYELSEYNDAATSFKEAYRLSKDATYLFNIAQAYKQAKNCSEAGKFYQRYLSAVPDADNKDKVNGYIEEMKRCK